jgi:hypothetical protein
MGRSSYAQGGGRIMRCRKRGWRSFSLSRQCARSGRTIAQAGHKRPKQYQRRFIVLVGMGSWKGSAEVHEPPFPRVLFRKTAWIRLHCLSQIGSFEEHCPDQVWTSPSILAPNKIQHMSKALFIVFPRLKSDSKPYCGLPLASQIAGPAHYPSHPQEPLIVATNHFPSLI